MFMDNSNQIEKLLALQIADKNWCSVKIVDLRLFYCIYFIK